MHVQTKFLRLCKPVSLVDPIDDWRVCWLGGWDKCRVFFVVKMEEGTAAPAHRLSVSVTIRPERLLLGGVPGILMLEIEVREAVLGITVLEFSGRIATGPYSAGIQVARRKLVGENRKKLVFDLGEVNIDSTGLGILTFCSATMRAGGGALRVAGA